MPIGGSTEHVTLRFQVQRVQRWRYITRLCNIMIFLWCFALTDYAHTVSSLSPVMWVEKLSQQLGRPTRSVGGWLVSKFFKNKNQMVEEMAALHCAIQPGDTVLELGHGPGLGLHVAAKMLTGPRGHLIGVDYSEYMHQVKSFFF